MKIIIDDKIPYIRGRVERLADEVVYLPGTDIGPDDVRDADVLLIRTRTRCDRRLLEGSRVQFIVTATIGFDHLDVQYLQEAGIAWTNCPGCNATSVAQYVRNSLLVMERQGMICLREATLGIIGYGHVGTAVCETMRPYVGKILVNDPPLEVESLKFKVESSTLEALQASCDIITLHTPLTTESPYPTYHLVDDGFLHSVKKSPILINAARGGVVDEAALEQALDEGRIRQAVIDTWEGEPDISRSLLRKVFIGTPHIAGYSADGKANATRMTLEALRTWKGNDSETAEDIVLEPMPPASDPLQRYNPVEDSERLKSQPEAFEFLRGHYPIRRE